MKIILHLFSVSMAFIASTNAMAADSKQPFNGMYAGASVALRSDKIVLKALYSNTTVTTSSASKQGFNGAIFVGYNKPVGSNVILGIEADAAIQPGNLEDLGYSFKGKYSFGIYGRAGVKISGPSLIYAKIGIAHALGGLRDVTYIGNTRIVGLEELYSGSGLAIGGGLEIMVNENISAKIEYMHASFGTYKLVGSSSTEEYSLKRNIFSYGMSYHF
jgi:opacity protein-like surface antigen